jgi:asparagine synthase (glutamine-hydrolysing)
MCGIFGVVGFLPEQRQLQEVLRLLKHRGPDGEGVVRTSSGVLAHTRLSIIDLSPLGRQPMSNYDGSVWIALNGEIYNYIELRDELAGYPFRSHTDTEVVLAAYERWGEAFLERLRGMFAFGLWDERRRTLLCATDRFSIKPLYYSRWRDALWFSSEVKPLAACGVPLAPNDEALFSYLAYGLLDHNEQTLFHDIFQLRPGTYLQYRDGQILILRYWDLPQESEGDEPRLTESDVESELEHAVRLHLRGDVEVSLSLSSGTDSNALRALIPSLSNGGPPRRCFTYCFPGTPYDEGVRVERLLSGDGHWKLYRTEVSPEHLLDHLGEAVFQAEVPIGGLGVYGYWLNARTVADAGVKVLLDGQGADEVFAGYKYYYGLRLGELASQGRIDELGRELAAFNEVHGSSIRDPSAAFELLTRRDAPDTLMRAPDGTTMASTYLTPEFRAAHAEVIPEFPSRFSCPVRRARYLDLFYLKIPKLLRFQDRCAMAWGVEVRVPYLDHVLVERLFAFPAHVLLRGGMTKAMLRSLVSRLVPSWPNDEPKLYVATPQREWMKGPMRDTVHAFIEDSVLARTGYVDAAGLRYQFDEYCRNPDLGNSFFAWKFIVLELWHRAFLGPRPVVAVRA